MITFRPWKTFGVLAGAGIVALVISYIRAQSSEADFYQRSPLMQDLRLEAQKDPVAGRDTSAVLRKHFPVGVDKQAAVKALRASGFMVTAVAPCKARDYDACEVVTLDASLQQALTTTSHRIALTFAHGRLTTIHGHIGLTGL